jgi:hypothetical protein
VHAEPAAAAGLAVLNRALLAVELPGLVARVSLQHNHLPAEPAPLATARAAIRYRGVRRARRGRRRELAGLVVSRQSSNPQTPPVSRYTPAVHAEPAAARPHRPRCPSQPLNSALVASSPRRPAACRPCGVIAAAPLLRAGGAAGGPPVRLLPRRQRRGGGAVFPPCAQHPLTITAHVQAQQPRKMER